MGFGQFSFESEVYHQIDWCFKINQIINLPWTKMLLRWNLSEAHIKKEELLGVVLLVFCMWLGFTLFLIRIRIQKTEREREGEMETENSETRGRWKRRGGKRRKKKERMSKWSSPSPPARYAYIYSLISFSLHISFIFWQSKVVWIWKGWGSSRLFSNTKKFILN